MHNGNVVGVIVGPADGMIRDTYAVNSIGGWHGGFYLWRLVPPEDGVSAQPAPAPRAAASVCGCGIGDSGSDPEPNPQRAVYVIVLHEAVDGSMRVALRTPRF